MGRARRNPSWAFPPRTARDGFRCETGQEFWRSSPFPVSSFNPSGLPCRSPSVPWPKIQIPCLQHREFGKKPISRCENRSAIESNPEKLPAKFPADRESTFVKNSCPASKRNPSAGVQHAKAHDGFRCAQPILRAHHGSMQPEYPVHGPDLRRLDKI